MEREKNRSEQLKYIHSRGRPKMKQKIIMAGTMSNDIPSPVLSTIYITIFTIRTTFDKHVF